jgi:hypothetical protein
MPNHNHVRASLSSQSGALDFPDCRGPPTGSGLVNIPSHTDSGNDRRPASCTWRSHHILHSLKVLFCQRSWSASTRPTIPVLGQFKKRRRSFFIDRRVDMAEVPIMVPMQREISYQSLDPLENSIRVPELLQLRSQIRISFGIQKVILGWRRLSIK